MKKLLLIQLDQFGYLTDSLKWCEYLRKDYHIHVVCYDSKQPRVEMDNVRVTYVQLSACRLLHALRFICTALLQLLLFKGTIWVVAFPHCDVLKRLLPWKKMHLDIRTVSIDRDEALRASYDAQLCQYARCYDSVSVISQGVKERLGISQASVLPLGSDVISTAKKDYSQLNFLYVGTLRFRDIHKTLEGASLFHQKHPDVAFHYDIVGDGFPDEHPEGLASCYREWVRAQQLESYITVHGARPYAALAPFIQQASYGFSFVPMTPWYDVQPPTKTFEYALSGLFVLATRTLCNEEVVNATNGYLMDDTPEAVCEAMEFVYRHHTSFCESEIRASLETYQWPQLISRYLKPIV